MQNDFIDIVIQVTILFTFYNIQERKKKMHIDRYILSKNSFREEEKNKYYTEKKLDFNLELATNIRLIWAS